MSKFKIVFDRNKCIGAYSCVAVDPEKWKPANDSKVDLEGSAQANQGIFEREIKEEEVEKSRAAAAVCPVAAIQVIEE